VKKNIENLRQNSETIFSSKKKIIQVHFFLFKLIQQWILICDIVFFLIHILNLTSNHFGEQFFLYFFQFLNDFSSWNFTLKYNKEIFHLKPVSKCYFLRNTMRSKAFDRIIHCWFKRPTVYLLSKYQYTCSWNYYHSLNDIGII